MFESEVKDLVDFIEAYQRMGMMDSQIMKTNKLKKANPKVRDEAWKRVYATRKRLTTLTD